MLKESLIISIILNASAAILSSIIVFSYFSEIKEVWSIVNNTIPISKEETILMRKRLNVTTLWGLYVMAIGSHTSFFVLDILASTRRLLENNTIVLDQVRELRRSATFQVAMWSTIAVVESLINYFELVDYENYGFTRIWLCFGNWTLKGLEANGWRMLKRELKKKV